MQVSNPLQAVYETVTGDHDKFPKTDFVFGFRYPGSAFSRLEGLTFETEVVWREDANQLLVSTAPEGITFKYWPRLERFLVQLNAELRPYVNSLGGGGLRAVTLVADEHTLVPMYEFRIVYRKIKTPQLQEVFSRLLFERAALTLWLTRTVFGYVSAVGEEPDAFERMRLLCREYARFSMNLIKDTQESSVPRGFYEPLWGKGFSGLQ